MCANHESFKRMRCWYYCRSGNIREVLIFSTFARRSNLRIEEFRENYYHKSDTFIEIDNLRILDFTKIPKITTSRKSKHAKNTRPDSIIRWYCSPDIRCRKRWEQLTSHLHDSNPGHNWIIPVSKEDSYRPLVQRCPNKHEEVPQCWFNDGPPSLTLAQH